MNILIGNEYRLSIGYEDVSGKSYGYHWRPQSDWEM